MKINLQLFAPVKVLARGWKVEIQNPDNSSWVEIKGLNSLTFDGEKNDADTTTYDDQGWQSHLVASRGRSLALQGYFLEDQTTKARDDGQALVETYSDAIGQDSLAYFRLTSPAGTVRYFNASVNVSGIGGGNDDPTGWNADLTVSGALSISDIAVTGISVTPATLSLAPSAISDKLVTVFTPVDATNKALTYATSDDDVAVVTSEGRVIAIANGSATITITATGGVAVTDTVAVTVATP